MNANSIQIFKNDLFGEVRTLTDEKGEAWFVGVDVARALGYKNPSNTLNVHVDLDDRKYLIINQDTRNRYVCRNPKIVIINESGLYSLVLSSKLPQAREFKHWVTSEVLPQIRKTGGYIPVAEEDDEKNIIAKAMLIAKQTIEAQKQQLEAQKPMVEFAEAVIVSKDTCTVAELAKLLFDNGVNIGQNRLFAWLRDNRYLCFAEHHRNEPYQKWVEAGLFKVKTSQPWYDEEGEPHYQITTLVTGEGQKFFLKKLTDLSPRSPLQGEGHFAA